MIEPARSVPAPQLDPRLVTLPADLGGALWLAPMPGRLRPLADDLAALAARGVGRIVCLTPAAEIAARSPDYARWLATPPDMIVNRLPIADFAVPATSAPLAALAVEVAQALRAGERVLIHCAAGIGRTGMFATAVLLAAGLPLPAATARIAAAGSGPETAAQQALLADLAAAGSGAGG